MENKLFDIVCKVLDEKLAEDITIIDFNHTSPICDGFIIATARNYRHASSLLDFVEDEVYKEGYEVRSKNDEKDSPWLVMDLDDAILHIFLAETREKYNLEKLWADQTIIKK